MTSATVVYTSLRDNTCLSSCKNCLQPISNKKNLKHLYTNISATVMSFQVLASATNTHTRTILWHYYNWSNQWSYVSRQPVLCVRDDAVFLCLVSKTVKNFFHMYNGEGQSFVWFSTWSDFSFCKHSAKSIRSKDLNEEHLFIMSTNG